MPVSLPLNRLPPEQQLTALKLAQIHFIKKRSGHGKLKAYYRDPVAFMHDCIEWPEGGGPKHYQEKIARRLYSEKYDHRIAEYGPHGIGKSTLGSFLLHHFSLCSEEMAESEGGDWKAITTASSWTQLRRYFWPEVHKWAGKLRWDRIGREPYSRDELLDLAIKLNHGQAFAVASSNPAFIEGAHAKRLLYIFDEAKAIIAETFDAVEGAFANIGTNDYEAYALALSTPGNPSGRFFEICERKPGYEDWHVVHVRMQDALEAGVFSAKWVKQRMNQWGKNSQLFQNRVLGKFFADNNEGVIPLDWVEAAVERWREWTKDGTISLEEMAEKYAYKSTGVDVAWMGEDKSVLSHNFQGDRIHSLKYLSKRDPMHIAGLVKGVTEKLGGIPRVDIIGIGGGVVASLNENKIKNQPFNAAQAAHPNMKDNSGLLGFANKRSAAWWQFREKLDPQINPDSTVCIPDDPILIGDLTTPKWRVLSGGRIQLESKEEFKKRLERSSDAGDSVIQAAFDDAEDETQWMKVLY